MRPLTLLLSKYNGDYNSDNNQIFPLQIKTNLKIRNSKFALKMDSLYFNLMIKKAYNSRYGEC
jgi:hypothetical protein